MRLSFAFASGLALLAAAPAAFADIAIGDILLNNFAGTPNVQRYSAAGVLQQTFGGTGSNYEGASITPDGMVVTTHRGDSNFQFSPGVNLFTPSGAETTFSTPEITGYGSGDVSVFADGTLAVVDQGTHTGTQNGTPAVRFYTQGGASVRSTTLGATVTNDPFGCAAGPDNTIWVADRNVTQLFHVREDGTLLPNVSLSFSPRDLVVDRFNGSLWVSDNTNTRVQHLTTAGVSIGSFSVAVSGDFAGIAQARDGTLYVTGTTSTSVFHYSEAGDPLGSFAISAPDTPLFLTVAPEPEGLALLAVGGPVLFARRRQTRRRGRGAVRAA